MFDEETGTGPPVLAPPFVARPPPSSDICACSSDSTGVNECGLRNASSNAYCMAAYVRLEIRSAGCEAWV